MRKTYAIVALALAVTLVAATSLFAQDAEDLTGREIVEQGVRGSVSGTLVPEGEEWRLQAGARLYELHLGQFGHDGQAAAALRAGAHATVNGFISGDHISPITLETGDTTLRFRAEDGRPLWGGMRLGPNAEDPSGKGSGASGSGWGRNRRQG
jgi:hypothetical protein